GYDFAVTSGPNIESVIFPILPGDMNGYDIYGFDNATHGYGIIGHVNGGVVFTFSTGGVSEFKVRGIDIAAGLDPANTHAFVTGLTFVSAGEVSMTQTPTGIVPEPEIYAMLLAGLGVVGFIARRSKRLQRFA
ncbi:MAG TPA: PEP-CTERM sorting domain-containing protein, partial [Bryobacteraceae bacterium]|nr:PEP-CTERM sorting domain-containing protein [Bryobacteraceae bacterium]